MSSNGQPSLVPKGQRSGSRAQTQEPGSETAAAGPQAGPGTEQLGVPAGARTGSHVAGTGLWGLAGTDGSGQGKPGPRGPGAKSGLPAGPSRLQTSASPLPASSQRQVTAGPCRPHPGCAPRPRQPRVWEEMWRMPEGELQTPMSYRGPAPGLGCSPHATQRPADEKVRGAGGRDVTGVLTTAESVSCCPQTPG